MLGKQPPPPHRVAATCNNQYLIAALVQSYDVDYHKRFLNLFTIVIINANYGTSIVPMESIRHIYHGNGDNSISPNDHLHHYCTGPPIWSLAIDSTPGAAAGTF